MYEELVNVLRCVGELSSYKRKLMSQAADAIEELQNDLERGQDYYEFWKHKAEQESKMLQIAISNMPCWIPVTERLPEDGQRVLAFKTLDTKPPVPWYLILSYSTNLESVSEYEFQNETHGGFYEYDDGYYERTGITHWMPLPEPPKEE